MTPDEIRAIRKRFGLTQASLARMLDVSVNTISRWEAGSREPQQKYARQMRDLALSTAELDAEHTLDYATADEATQDAMDAVRAAERKGLSPLAMTMAGSAVREHRAGMSAAEWIMSKQHLGADRVEQVVAELSDAGLWPWSR